MAIWQFDLILHPPPGEDVASDGSPAWSDERRRAIEALLEATLLRGRRWTPEFRTWGREYGGRVDLLLTGDKLVEIYSRVDMRVDWQRLLGLLVRLAEVAGVESFETVDEQCIPAGPDSLLAAAMASRAVRFLRDPEEYFRSLEDDPIKDWP
jgi:hypothetical protein